MSDPPPPDWEKIIDKHAERLFRIAYRILGSVHDAEDVCQAVFAEAMIAHSAGPIRSWTGLLVRLATLRSIDRLRRKRTDEDPLPEGEIASSPSNPVQQVIASELATWLRDEIQRLPDQQASVFSLAYFEQLSRSEIVATLGISPEAVSTALYKARNNLSNRLPVVYGDQS